MPVIPPPEAGWAGGSACSEGKAGRALPHAPTPPKVAIINDASHNLNLQSHTNIETSIFNE